MRETPPAGRRKLRRLIRVPIFNNSATLSMYTHTHTHTHESSHTYLFGNNRLKSQSSQLLVWKKRYCSFEAGSYNTPSWEREGVRERLCGIGNAADEGGRRDFHFPFGSQNVNPTVVILARISISLNQYTGIVFGNRL